MDTFIDGTHMKLYFLFSKGGLNGRVIGSAWEPKVRIVQVTKDLILNWLQMDQYVINKMF